MRFWHKTYLLTLSLFLVCLNVGLFSLAFYTYHENTESLERTCQAENDYIARSFEQDWEEMQFEGKDTSPVLLMRQYGAHYVTQGIQLALYHGEYLVYSSFAEEVTPPEAGVMMQTTLDGARSIVISSTVNNTYRFVYAKNVSSLDERFRSLMTSFTVVSAVVSLVFSLCLYLTLKKLSIPLEKLRRATEAIADGNLCVTADENGNDELAMLAKSFNSMVGQLKEHMGTLEQDAYRKQMLVDNMAHELRTPLTSIYGFAEYIEKAAATEEQRLEAAKRIISEARRLQKISEKILDTAYIRNNDIPRARVDLALLLSDTAKRLERTAEKSGVSLVLAAGSAAADGDETLLSMLFYNLTENAIKACVGGGVVSLFCKGKTVTVADNGKGMTAEQLSHITEPFYRTDKSRSRAEGGAGLGLALCKQIAELHGATLDFESEAGTGTTVKVTFIT